MLFSTCTLLLRNSTMYSNCVKRACAIGFRSGEEKEKEKGES